MQGDMLALLYLHPERSFSLTEIALEIGTNVKAVHTEANRLVGGGFANQTKVGQARLLQAPPATPLTNALAELLVLSYGPLPLLRELFAKESGIVNAFIYGSWAARYSGRGGPIPNDVDVAVVGDIGADTIDEIAIEAQRILRKPVDIRRIPVDLWSDSHSNNTFIHSLKSNPRVSLVGEDPLN